MAEVIKASRCFGHPHCPNTAGYNVGGDLWICWLHILLIPGGYLYYRNRPVIMPSTAVQVPKKGRKSWTTKAS